MSNAHQHMLRGAINFGQSVCTKGWGCRGEEDTDSIPLKRALMCYFWILSKLVCVC